jgi:hypothetical protein
VLPESSVDEELRTGTLCAMRVSAARVSIPVVLIHPRRAYLSGGGARAEDRALGLAGGPGILRPHPHGLI